MEWDEHKVRRAKEMARGTLGQEFAKMPLRYAAGILIAKMSQPGDGVQVRTATATLVYTGKKYIAITCRHVLECYRRMGGASDGVVFQLGDLKFNPDERLIDESDEYDLATLCLNGYSPEEISDNPEIGRSFYSPPNWPPARIEDNAIVSLGGFPELWREYETLKEVILPTFSIGTVFVSGTTKNQFGIKLEREYWVQSFNLENREDLHDFSGLSGSPVILERCCGVVRFDIVGVAKEFNDSLDYVVVTHLDLVGENGTFR